MDNQILGQNQQQMAEQSISGIDARARSIPVMHTEPDALKAETIQRLKHYSAQEEKLTFELRRVRIMIHACQSMLNSFDEKQMADDVPSREY